MTTDELVQYFTTLAGRSPYFGTGLGMTLREVARHAATPTSVIPHYVWQDLLQFTDIPRDVLRELARQRTG